MFNVFINSLFSHTPDAYIVAYADDITLHVRSNTHLECIALMQRSMDAVDAWSARHGLSINYAKCFAMLILPCAKKQTDTIAQLRFSSTPICFVRNLKILGVTFSDDLSWHYNSSHIKSLVNGMIKSLQRVSGCLNIAARVQILNAFILPHIKCCSTVWGNGSTATANSMDKIPQRSAKIVLHDANAILNFSTSSATAHFKSLSSSRMYCVYALL